MEGMGFFKFSDVLTELPVPPHAAVVVGTFSVLFIYNSEHNGLIFEHHGCHIIFTRSPLFHVCVYISIFFASTLCMCVTYLRSFDRFF